MPWLTALQAVGLSRRNVNRKLILATHIISINHGSNKPQPHATTSLPAFISKVPLGIQHFHRGEEVLYNFALRGAFDGRQEQEGKW